MARAIPVALSLAEIECIRDNVREHSDSSIERHLWQKFTTLAIYMDELEPLDG